MRLAHMLAVLALTGQVVWSGSVRAVQPDEILSDPSLEQRARQISQELRCVVCQNQSIDDSNASLARDLRILVRERLRAGDSDKQVIDFIVARYGSFVLLRPPVQSGTLVLWAGPAAMVIFGSCVVVFYFRRRRESISEDEFAKGEMGGNCRAKGEENDL